MRAKLIKNPWAETDEVPEGMTIGNIYEVTEEFAANWADYYFRIIDDNGQKQAWNTQLFEIVEQEIKYPAVYQHFKHDEKGCFNNYIYVTLGIAETIDELEWRKFGIVQSIGIFKETETEHEIAVYNYKNKLYIPSLIIPHDKYVLYKSLCNNRCYARPLEMFAGLVDKQKYPSVNQKFRFELVKGQFENYYIHYSDNYN